MIFVIYKIENKINHKLYIGKHITNNEFDNYMGSGKIVSRAIKKHGINSFSKKIIEYSSAELLNERETYWIKYYNSITPFGYNLTCGGDGGDTLSNHPNKIIIGQKISSSNKGRKFSKEHKKKLSEAKKDFIPWNIGIKHSQKSKEKMSIAKIGKKRTEESKLKQSLTNTGSHRSEQTKEKMKLAWTKRGPVSTETINKIKLSKEHITNETRNLMSLSAKKIKECPYCHKLINTGNYNRWHNNNCKLK